MTDEKRSVAYAHIRAELPGLNELIAKTGEVPMESPREEPVADALVRIVAGQMLSRFAARSIVERMRQAAQRRGCGPLYRLEEDELRACGLSRGKAKTVRLIAEMNDKEPGRLERWRTLSFDELKKETAQIWGLGDWSASVLAIFHFAHPDVFPLSDGSLVRAIRLVEQQVPTVGSKLRHEAAAPFRSYLALTLWAALDNGHLAAT